MTVHRQVLPYTLRTLFVGVTLLALALAWWMRPQTIEIMRDDGTLVARFQVRRDWRGRLVARGLQSWYLSDGQCFRQQEVHGPRLIGNEFSGAGRYGEPVYPSHVPPDPPTADYVGVLRRDNIPISTDLPSTAGERFSYP